MSNVIILIKQTLSSILSVEECRSIITQFGVGEVTAAQVARVLGMMARTHSGLTDGIPLQVSTSFSTVKNQLLLLFLLENTPLL